MINSIYYLCEFKNTSFYITYQVKCADLYIVGKSKQLIAVVVDFFYWI